MRIKFNKKGEGEIVWNELIPWIIAIVILVVLGLAAFFLSGKGTEYIQAFKDALRFR